MLIRDSSRDPPEPMQRTDEQFFASRQHDHRSTMWLSVGTVWQSKIRQCRRTLSPDCPENVKDVYTFEAKFHVGKEKMNLLIY